MFEVVQVVAVVLLVLGLLAFLSVMMLRLTKPKAPPNALPALQIAGAGADRANEVAQLGREYQARLKILSEQIEEQQIGAQIANMRRAASQILSYIAKNPAQVGKVGTFMDYYFPTAIKLLEKWNEYNAKAIKGENINEILQNTAAALTTIEAAFEKQLDGLYNDVALDLKAEAAVLESTLKNEK